MRQERQRSTLSARRVGSLAGRATVHKKGEHIARLCRGNGEAILRPGVFLRTAFAQPPAEDIPQQWREIFVLGAIGGSLRVLKDGVAGLFPRANSVELTVPWSGPRRTMLGRSGPIAGRAKTLLATARNLTGESSVCSVNNRCASFTRSSRGSFTSRLPMMLNPSSKRSLRNRLRHARPRRCRSRQ